MHLEELRGILLSEREAGKLISIPYDIYHTTLSEIKLIQDDVYATDDPFSEEARQLIEKVASIRATSDEVFRLRTEKILFLAQSQANGEYIDRDELKLMIPVELDLFNIISDSIRKCRNNLLEGKSEPEEKTVPAHTNDYEEEMPDDEAFGFESDNSYPVTVPNAEGEPASYVLVRVLGDMEPFMGVDGLSYEILKNDIITIPRRNADVLAERNIVLNINMGK